MRNLIYRICPNCNKTKIYYKSIYSYKKANQNKSICPSCRTSKNNKSINRNVKKNNNPTWKGFEDIPGKVFSKLQRGAEQRSIKFELTIEDLWKQYISQNKKCAYSGLDLIWGINASVDRINSKLSYLKNNIHIVHKDINMLKRNMDHDIFINWCKLISNNAN
jgi:hypothetical protein